GVHLLYIYPAEGLTIAAEIRNPKSEIVKQVESIYCIFTTWKVCVIAAEIRNPKSEIEKPDGRRLGG
ncbi:hypothetical protein L0128_16125, partial [candidate division KSB1 bacterium]|nr:hypothetical protein [candidate division KSB1 bacterium]